MSKKLGKKGKSLIISYIILWFQLTLSCIFVGLLFILNVIPLKYMVAIIALLVIMLFFTFSTQKRKRVKKNDLKKQHKIKRKKYFGRFVSVIMSVLLTLGSYYLLKTNNVLNKISDASVKIDKISVYVLKDDPATSIEDAKNYCFGVQSIIDKENTDKTVDAINDKLGSSIETMESDSIESMVDDLFSYNDNAIILNEAYVESILEQYPDFQNQTKIIYTYTIKTKIATTKSNKDVTKDTFVVYLSGIDTFGSISNTSRSDVNILAIVNPKTKQILLVSTPRDYYVETSVSGGEKDKLTHAGIYGIDCSMDTLSSLYDVDVDYYLRVNFTGFKDIIDALGGITVYSEQSFTSIDGYYYSAGENTLNGTKALSFSRERKAFANGDNQRGKNQMAVIKAMIKEACSTSLLTNYTDVMNGVSDSFQTNLSTNDISKLVKMQLNDMSGWNVVSYSATGTGDTNTTYSMPTTSTYVMIPDESSIATAKEKIQAVFDGKTIYED